MSPIAKAVEPHRAAAVKRAQQSATAVVAKLAEELAAAGWDLAKIAPFPSSMVSRRQYMMAKSRRVMFEQIANHIGGSGWRGKDTVEMMEYDAESAKRLIEQAKADASASFTSYIAKLTVKVGDVTSATISDGNLWDGAVLTVRRQDGSTERWRTKCILNVSCLGKVFNQWPTRRIK
jgi:hypothetical protein